MNDIMAERLKEARINSGYGSAADAARAFGWQISAYRHHENGESVQVIAFVIGSYQPHSSRLMRLASGANLQ